MPQRETLEPKAASLHTGTRHDVGPVAELGESQSQSPSRASLLHKPSKPPPCHHKPHPPSPIHPTSLPICLSSYLLTTSH